MSGDEASGAICPHCGTYVVDCECGKGSNLQVPEDFPLLKILPEVLSWDARTQELDATAIPHSIVRMVYSTTKDYPALTWGEALAVLYRGVQWDDSYLPDILQEDKMQNYLTRKHMWPPLKRSTAPSFAFLSNDPVAVADAASMGGAAGPGPSELECNVCGEEKEASNFLQAGCGHFFCKECWGE